MQHPSAATSFAATRATETPYRSTPYLTQPIPRGVAIRQGRESRQSSSESSEHRFGSSFSGRQQRPDNGRVRSKRNFFIQNSNYFLKRN